MYPRDTYFLKPPGVSQAITDILIGLTGVVGGVWIEEGNGFTLVSTTTGAPNTMNVLVDITRKIVVDHHL